MLSRDYQILHNISFKNIPMRKMFFIYRGDNGRRFILQQPLLYSETAYNYRRLGELWYQLMHSGNH
jgi:hypothetical protein